MALDGGRVGGGARLDHVGIQRPLHQERSVGNPVAGSLEGPDELLADHLSLGLGLGDALQRGEELGGRVETDEVHSEVTAEGLLHLVGLALAQQTGVDQHARQPGADGLVHQRGGHRGVHAPRQAADGPAMANLVLDRCHGGVDDRVHRPARTGAAGPPQEALHHIVAMCGVLYLRMELHPEQSPLGVLERGHRRSLGGRGDLCARRRLGNGIEVAHPHRLDRRQSGQQDAAGAGHRHLGPAVLAPLVGADRAAQLLGYQLGPVADAEDRYAEVVDGGVEGRRALDVHRGRATAEDHAGGPAGRDLGRGDRRGHDLAVHLALAHPPGDQLRVLGPEVHHQDGVEGTARPGRGPCHGETMATAARWKSFTSV